MMSCAAFYIILKFDKFVSVIEIFVDGAGMNGIFFI